MNQFDMAVDAPYSLLEGKQAFDKPVVSGSDYIRACKRYRRHSQVKWTIKAPVRPINRVMKLLAGT